MNDQNLCGNDWPWTVAILTYIATTNRDGIFESTNFVSDPTNDFRKMGWIYETNACVVANEPEV